ncbi:MAG: choice-of-anchor D domain-containing protein, partial [Acidobacteriaceae bacterium]
MLKLVSFLGNAALEAADSMSRPPFLPARHSSLKKILMANRSKRFITLAALFLFVAMSTAGAFASTSGPKLVLGHYSINFGSVTVGKTVAQSVTLASKGTAPLLINSVSISGVGFTMKADAAFPLTLNPGQSTTVHLYFTPVSNGTVTGALTINSNSYTGSIQQVSLSGTGVGGSSTQTSTPTLSVSPGSVSFGSVTVGSTSTQAVTLSSTGTAAVQVSSAALSGSGFSVSGATFPLTLNPGQQ